MRKDKLKQELKKELLNELSNELVDNIVEKVSERVIDYLPVSMKLELEKEKSAKVYDRKSKPPEPEYDLSEIEQKAKSINQYNKQHSLLTQSKRSDKSLKQQLDERRKVIESLEEEKPLLAKQQQFTN